MREAEKDNILGMLTRMTPRRKYTRRAEEEEEKERIWKGKQERHQEAKIK